MSSKELERGEVIAKVLDGMLSYKKAKEQLALSFRQTYRLCKKYRENGLQGLAHQNRGRSSNRKISPRTGNIVLELINKHYPDFGPQLIKEQLEERHHLRFSRERIRRLMIKENLWKVNRRKTLSVYQRRCRRSQEGELIQIDGSYEKWFEDRSEKCCLINMVDDATGKLQELYFVKHESTESYLKCMNRYIKRHGILALYSDRHTIFKSPKSELRHLTHFGKAMKELDIELIFANTPQAKGRVERSHGTLQDRLIKLMRLENISSIEEGNQYLEKFRIDYNKRFGRAPQDLKDGHKELPINIKLENVLCVKEERKISKNLTFHYQHKTYQIIQKNNGRRLMGKPVLIYDINDKLIVECHGEQYEYTIYEERPYAIKVMDRKRLEAFLDKKKAMTIKERIRKKISINF